MSRETPKDPAPRRIRDRGVSGATDTQQLFTIPTPRNSDASERARFEPGASLGEALANPHRTTTRAHVEYDLKLLTAACTIAGAERETEANFIKRGVVLAYSAEEATVFPNEQIWLDKESSKSWKDRFVLSPYMYFIAFMCGFSAVVQGMDQSAVNGAQIGYKIEFGITNEWTEGLVNGAPYLCCALIGCWTSPFLNKWTGRRGTIFISCTFAIASGIWQMCVHSTWELFAARFIMGLAVGAKSSTTPAYAAECAPAKVRGAIGTQWQMWTAFGIMLGLIADVAFMNIHTPVWGTLSGWRIILGSTAAPPLFVCAMIPFAPESPRWLLVKGRYRAAYKSLCKLRKCRLQAARDLYNIHAALECQKQYEQYHPMTWSQRSLKLFTVSRNRHAAQSAGFLMFMQQACGINVIAYYSSVIFQEAGFSIKQALLVSLGTGIVNWLFAIPGMLTIDRKGRRSLLLWTFPMMSACLFFTGLSFLASNAETRLGLVATGIYVFECIYSPGMGPVPFTYSAEAFPLEVRDVGMSFATAICWGFNFVLALTFPAMRRAFGTPGAFSFYAAWNLFGFFYTYFYLPETMKRPLEELNAVFDLKWRDFAAYKWYKLPWMSGRALPKRLRHVSEVVVTTEHDKEKALASDMHADEHGSVLAVPENQAQGSGSPEQGPSSADGGKGASVVEERQSD